MADSPGTVASRPSDGLSGSPFVWTPGVAWAAGAMVAYAIAAWAFSHTLAQGLVLGTPAGWQWRAVAFLAATATALVLFMRANVRYMARDRLRIRLGLPRGGPLVRLRDSMELNWGVLGRDPAPVLGVLAKVTGRQAELTDAARKEAADVARKVRRRLWTDMALALVLASPLLLVPLWMGPGWPTMALPLAFMALIPFLGMLTAFRYQDPWLAWFQRHFMQDAGPG